MKNLMNKIKENPKSFLGLVVGSVTPLIATGVISWIGNLDVHETCRILPIATSITFFPAYIGMRIGGYFDNKRQEYKIK